MFFENFVLDDERVVNFMVKKLFLMCVCVAILMFCSIALANYPKYLNGDTNYVLVDGHMGNAYYVDKSSLVVQKYDPPQYIIAVNVVTANSAYDDAKDFYERGGQGKIIDTHVYRFFYNWDRTEMYWDNTGHNGWQYLSPNASWAETRIKMPAGEMAFYLAYNMKFYGTYRWRSDYSDKYYELFDDQFYK